MLFISSLHCYYKINILQLYSCIIVLVPSTLFQTYDITWCDILCDHGHMPLYCPKEKEKLN